MVPFFVVTPRVGFDGQLRQQEEVAIGNQLEMLQKVEVARLDQKVKLLKELRERAQRNQVPLSLLQQIEDELLFLQGKRRSVSAALTTDAAASVKIEESLVFKYASRLIEEASLFYGEGGRSEMKRAREMALANRMRIAVNDPDIHQLYKNLVKMHETQIVPLFDSRKKVIADEANKVPEFVNEVATQNQFGEKKSLVVAELKLNILNYLLDERHTYHTIEESLQATGMNVAMLTNKLHQNGVRLPSDMLTQRHAAWPSVITAANASQHMGVVLLLAVVAEQRFKTTVALQPAEEQMHTELMSVVHASVDSLRESNVPVSTAQETSPLDVKQLMLERVDKIEATIAADSLNKEEVALRKEEQSKLITFMNQITLLQRKYETIVCLRADEGAARIDGEAYDTVRTQTGRVLGGDPSAARGMEGDSLQEFRGEYGDEFGGGDEEEGVSSTMSKVLWGTVIIGGILAASWAAEKWGGSVAGGSGKLQDFFNFLKKPIELVRAGVRFIKD